MPDLEKNREMLMTRMRELEIACNIWVASNQAKDIRIEELEKECNHLRQRVARLIRQVGRRQHGSESHQLRSVK